MLLPPSDRRRAVPDQWELAKEIRDWTEQYAQEKVIIAKKNLPNNIF